MDANGPALTHIWITVASPEPPPQELLLRIYWDTNNAEREAPLVDFSASARRISSQPEVLPVGSDKALNPFFHSIQSMRASRFNEASKSGCLLF